MLGVGQDGCSYFSSGIGDVTEQLQEMQVGTSAQHEVFSAPSVTEQTMLFLNSAANMSLTHSDGPPSYSELPRTALDSGNMFGFVSAHGNVTEKNYAGTVQVTQIKHEQCNPYSTQREYTRGCADKFQAGRGYNLQMPTAEDLPVVFRHYDPIAFQDSEVARTRQGDMDQGSAATTVRVPGEAGVTFRGRQARHFQDERGVPQAQNLEGNFHLQDMLHSVNSNRRSQPSNGGGDDGDDGDDGDSDHGDERRPPFPQRPLNFSGYVRPADRKTKKAALYTGTTSWLDYLVHFEMVAQINRWSRREMALELATSLRDSALAVLSDIDQDGHLDYDTLVAALTTRFEPPNYVEVYRAELKSRLRDKDEHLNVLAQDIKRLIRKVYPGAPRVTRDRLAMESFVDALNDAEMEWAVHQHRPVGIDEALQYAMEYEAFRKSRKQRSLNRPVRLATVQDMENSSGTVNVFRGNFRGRRGRGRGGAEGGRTRTCWVCGSGEHFRADCEQYKSFCAWRDQENSASDLSQTGNSQ